MSARLTKSEKSAIRAFLDTVSPVPGGDAGAAADPGAAATSRGRDSCEPSVPSWTAQRDPAMLASRAALPAAAHRDNVLARIEGDDARESYVVLIRGATGCGKSTQVPQFLLERAAERGTPCRIIVAQPRRLAAVSLAERVADELGTGAGGVGALCGYRIRGESKVSDKTLLTFCTTGVLLRMLDGGDGAGGCNSPLLQQLSQFTHIVIDEVHERSVDSDLLLLVLKRALQEARAAGQQAKVPKIVLMSATVQASTFVDYFTFNVGDTKRSGGDGDDRSDGGSGGGAATESLVTVVDIPGRTFPVEVAYLEDAIQACRYVLPRDSWWARDKPLPDTPRKSARAAALREAVLARDAADAAAAEFASGQGSSRLAENAAAHAAKAANSAAAAGCGDTATIPGSAATDWLSEIGPAGANALFGGDDSLGKTLRAMDLRVVNFDLVETLVAAHVQRSKGDTANAVLIFLPGAAEIDSLCEQLAAGPLGASLQTLPLHSQLSSAEQQRAFKAPPRGITKVVCATDIAETSVTIPDVTLVIDGGLARKVSCDTRTGAPHLRTERISIAAARQRAGRAGRVRSGSCFHLLCRVEAVGDEAVTGAAPSMAADPAPEVAVVPLESLCLRVRALIGDGDDRRLTQVLGALPTPPPPAAVARAIDALVALGALRPEDEQLTRLGRQLAKLPVEPRIGKALVYGARLGCVSPVALLAAATTAPRPPLPRNGEGAALKRALDASSDLLSVVRLAGGEDMQLHGALAIAARELVHAPTLRALKSAAKRLAREATHVCGVSTASADTAAWDMALVKACLVAGLGPAQLMRVGRAGAAGKKKTSKKEAHPSDVKQSMPLQLRWCPHHGRASSSVCGGERVLKPHSSSLLSAAAAPLADDSKRSALASVVRPAGAAQPDDMVIVAGVMSMANGVAAMDTTLITPLAALLFAGHAGALPTATELPVQLQAAAMVEEQLPGQKYKSKKPKKVQSETPAADPVLVAHVSGQRITVPGGDEALNLFDGLRAEIVRQCADGSGDEVETAALRRLLSSLLGASMGAPWAGVPAGWEYDVDSTGKPLYRSVVDTKMAAQREKPSEPAAVVAKREAAMRAASAQRRAAEAERAEQARASARAAAKDPAVLAAKVEAEAKAAAGRDAAAKKRAADAAAAQQKAEAARQQRAAEEAARLAEQKAATVRRVEAEAAAVANRAQRGTLAWSVRGGVAALLAELELTERYAAKFADAGFDDSALAVLAALVDDGDDSDDGGEESQGVGAAAVDDMIDRVGLIGGSAVKMRKRLLDHKSFSKGGRGGSGSGRGRGGGRGGGGGGRGDKGRGSSSSKGKGKGKGKTTAASAPKPKAKPKKKKPSSLVLG